MRIHAGAEVVPPGRGALGLRAGGRVVCHLLLASGLMAGIVLQASVHITHQYANTDSQSVVGLPSGSDKTIIDKQGDLHWTEWSIKHRGDEIPFLISTQMDGTLSIQLFSGSSSGALAPMSVLGQHLYRGRFPFVVTGLESKAGLKAEEVVFPVKHGAAGLDVVRIRVENPGLQPASLELQLAGKDRNLPAFVTGHTLATHDGKLVARVEGEGGRFSSRIDNLLLAYDTEIGPKSSAVIWIERPYDWQPLTNAMIASWRGPELMKEAVAFWESFWGRGMEINLPEKEIEDFYYSSFAYLYMLTEYDAQGNLWMLDGPTVYRTFWARNEYYPAYAMDMTGYPAVAGQTIQFMVNLQRSDGRWDMPLMTSYSAWDNVGYAMATVWTHYEFTHDRAWLARVYPHLLAAARWIQYNREQTELPANAPAASREAKPPLLFNCQRPGPPVFTPPGEKPLSWGLLPWGYGDSGLPAGHGYTHNVMPLYGIQCARQAAITLGRSSDAEWLGKEYADYKAAILASIQRSVKLEKGSPAYLPAMPTCPQCAWSQTLRAVFPSGLFSPGDPLVSGLLARMRRTALQGLPTNMAWLGPSGVWPAESLEVAQTYLLRGDVKDVVELLIATLNHASTTDVWKEEIRVDKSLLTDCANKPNSPRAKNQTGTGDQPDGWANANLIMLIRNMLVREEGSALHLLSGIPPDWIAPGQSIGIRQAPTMLGPVSYALNDRPAGAMTLDASLPAGIESLVVHFPLPDGQKITSASVDGKRVTITSRSVVTLNHPSAQVHLRIEFSSSLKSPDKLSFRGARRRRGIGLYLQSGIPRCAKIHGCVADAGGVGRPPRLLVRGTACW
jgi:hypothetical protein